MADEISHSLHALMSASDFVEHLRELAVEFDSNDSLHACHCHQLLLSSLYTQKWHYVIDEHTVYATVLQT